MLQAVAAKVAENIIPMSTPGLIKVAEGLLAQRFDPERIVVGVEPYSAAEDANPFEPRLWPHRFDGPLAGGGGTRWTFHPDAEAARRYIAQRESTRRWRGGR